MILRYTRMNGYFKTAVCLLIGGMDVFLQNSIITRILEGTAFTLNPVNFTCWNDTYINGNIILITCILLSSIFIISGIVINVTRLGKTENKPK